MRPTDKPNELRKMIVRHAMDRHVQLHNGNLMTGTSGRRSGIASRLTHRCDRRTEEENLRDYAHRLEKEKYQLRRANNEPRRNPAIRPPKERFT